MSAHQVLEIAAARGIPVGNLLVRERPEDVAGVPAHHWVLVDMPGGEVVIGGSDRGSFSVYGQYETDELAVGALAHLAGPAEYQEPPAPREVLAEAAQLLAQELKQKDGLGPADIPAGTALDHIGFESGHCLFLFNTPFKERSAPPTDIGLPRTGYVLRQPLPPTARVGHVVPWFGQPGGGIMVSLDHPIRYYYDLSYLDRFRLEGAAPRPVVRPA